MVTPTLLLALALAAPSDPVLLQFSAEWCGPCRAMQPVVQRLASKGFHVRQVDIDQHPDVASQFQVTAVPCFVLLVNGREVDRVTGGASYARLAEMFAQGRTVQGRTVQGRTVQGRTVQGRTVQGRTGQEREDERGAPSTVSEHGSVAQVRGQTPEKRGFGLPNPLNLLNRSEPAEQANFEPPSNPYAIHPTASQDGPVARSVGAAAVESFAAIMDRSMAATVRIKVEDPNGHSFGTGTIIDSHGREVLVVTCGHIFRDSQGKGHISVDMFGPHSGRGLAGTLVHYDLDHDIGLISFTPPSAVEPARVAPAGYRLERGSPVFSIGCNHGGDASIQQSRISAVDKYLGPPNVEVAGQPVDGRSGGGLFSKQGYLIGVCNAADPADDEGIYASLPSIQWQLDRIGQTEIYAKHDEPLVAAGPAPQSGRTTPQVPTHPEMVPVTHREAPTGDTEIICIVRSRNGGQGPGKLVVLSQPSQAFLSSLAQEAQQHGGALVPVDRNLLDSIHPSTPPLVRAQSTP